MKTAALVLASTFLFVGCATIDEEPKKEPKPPEIQVLDDNCVAVARYVRAIGLARNTGISPENAKVIARGNFDFPVDPIIKDVYSRPDMEPVAGSVQSYKVCTEYGYANFKNLLLQADANIRAAEVKDYQKELETLVYIANDKTGTPLKLKLEKTMKK